ncbi:MAG: pyridoxamine 5'-phosphate oxidase family protein [Thaumarchaeota archaeon]|nr:pyridoxamine 5'-phosphate oxidase family protein [Nitrososphaerota archaeon]
MSAPESSGVPQQVIDVLNNSKIGYLSVTSKKGELFSYPVAFHYANERIYFMTPVSAAKYKFVKANPVVSFIVDNREFTTNACGAMIQGRAKAFSLGGMFASIINVGPKMAKFAKKYPGMFTFYARGKGLPDERKLYKYRLIRVDPVKILYWTGYVFGKYVPRKAASKKDEMTGLPKGESSIDAVGTLIESADQELPENEFSIDSDWLSELSSAAAKGIVSQSERLVIAGLRGESEKGGKVSSGEKKLLEKWKSSGKRQD